MSDRVRVLVDLITRVFALAPDELRALRDALDERIRGARRTLHFAGDPMPHLDAGAGDRFEDE
jgi:hypothetical protein